MSIKRRYLAEIGHAAAAIPVFDTSDVAATREGVRQYVEGLIASGAKRPSDPSVREEEFTISGPPGAPDIRLRVYTPPAAAASGSAFVNFHGGGFFMGDLESEHLRCLTMTRDAGAVSIGVEYRLAPEHPYPAAAEDCYRALEWTSENAERLNIDPGRIAIGGGSAGGALSAAIALMARDRGGPGIALQMLFYPGLDDRGASASMIGGDDCHIWNSKNCRDMWDHYLGRDRDDVPAYAAPARATDLSGLPAAYIVTCEHDPLRDEAFEYSARLMASGVPVELHNYAGTVHAFDMLIACDATDQCLRESVATFARFTA
ncbi:MAG: alpha/beta hydrolase [Rhizobiaceae bacterium]